MPLTFEFPELGGFNLRGGTQVKPEFLALLLALSLYTASFIAEIVRAGILGISKGQSEAAHALGFRHNLTLRLVIVPQALRIIIPPLTSQYLNLTKNTSLAIAVGYPGSRCGRRHGAEPDRTVRRSGGDLDGGLPDAFAADFRVDELVQRARRAGRTVGAARCRNTRPLSANRFQPTSPRRHGQPA